MSDTYTEGLRSTCREAIQYDLAQYGEVTSVTYRLCRQYRDLVKGTAYETDEDEED